METSKTKGRDPPVKRRRDTEDRFHRENNTSLKFPSTLSVVQEHVTSVNRLKRYKGLVGQDKPPPLEGFCRRGDCVSGSMTVQRENNKTLKFFLNYFLFL